MKDRNGQNRRGKPRNDSSGIGRVRVFSNPGPDAEDRLRRLMSLMIRYATQDGQATTECESRVDDLHVEDTDEAQP